MVWYSLLFQNFPQFIVIHTVEDFGIVNKAEIDVFLELSCFFDDPVDVESEESEKVGLKLNIQKTKIMVSGPITSWEIDGKQWKQCQTLFLGAPKSLQRVIHAYCLEGNLWLTWIEYLKAETLKLIQMDSF